MQRIHSRRRLSILTAAGLIAVAPFASADSNPLVLSFDQSDYTPVEAFTLTVAGTPGTMGLLALDSDPGPTNIPGLGDVAIGFSADLILMTLPPIPATGKLLLDCDFPCDWPMLGIDLYTQAVSFDLATAELCLSNSAVLTTGDPFGICGPCAECDGGVTSMAFRYVGDTTAFVEVSEDGPGSTIFFAGVLDPGDTFEIFGTESDGKFPDNDVEIWVDGVEKPGVHVSCSKPVQPGLEFGDFLVLDATSLNGGPICPLGPDDCNPCDGGVTSLTFEYLGDHPATIEINDDGLGTQVFFSGFVAPGDLIEIDGTKADGKFPDNEIEVYVDGVVAAKIHVSCSQPVEPGLQFGPLLIVAGQSQKGGAMCPTDNPGGGDPGCGECKGGVTSLKLEYTGAGAAQIEINDDGLGTQVFFTGTVAPGEIVSIAGTEDDGKFPDNNIELFVDGHKVADIHVSCSQPVGPGIEFGPLVVLSGTSKDGGEICPEPKDDCETLGKPSQLTMLYTGATCGESVNGQILGDKWGCDGDVAGAASVMVLASDGGSKVWFDGVVDLGGTFVIDSNNEGASSLASNTVVEIFTLDGALLQSIYFHTSCSKPLAIDDTFGALQIVGWVGE